MLKQYLEKFNVKDELLVNAIIDLFIEQFNWINYIQSKQEINKEITREYQKILINHNIIYLLVMCENILKVKYTDSGIWFKINNRQFILDDGRYIEIFEDGE